MPTGVYKKTAETKQKMRERMIKLWQDPEYRERMIKISRTCSAETRKKRSERQKKRYEDPKEREKISKILTGRTKTTEHKKKLSEAMKGKHHTEETKRKMRGALRNNKSRIGTNPKYPEGSPAHFRRLSREIWELVHGEPVPKGMYIHHKDEDVTNIDPENLELRSPFGHQRWHRAIRPLMDSVEDLIKGGKTHRDSKSEKERAKRV